MTRLSVDSVSLLTFDCYGTLIDWETGILRALKPVLSRHGVTMADEMILELYGQLEATIESHGWQPYRDVLRKVMRQLSVELEFHPDEADINVLVDSIGDWPPFPDTAEAFAALKRRFALGIISNIDDDLFARTNHRLGVTFDHIVTAAQAKAYKPSPTIFDFAYAKMQVPRERIVHVAQSLYHDIAPANALGIRTVWVNRRRGKPGSGATPPATATPEIEVGSLEELVERVC